MNWIYFVLIAQGIWSITSLIDKIIISKGHIKNPLVYIVLNGAMNIFLIFLLPFVAIEPLKFTDFLIVMISGVLFSASVALYYKAVHYDEISRISVLAQLGPIFVLLFSFLFLMERLTKNHFIGFVFLVGAGIIISYKKAENSFRLSKAFWYMLASAFIGSISMVMAKHIFNATSFWNAFFWLRLSGFTALFVLLAPPIRHQFVETFRRMGKKIRGLLGFKVVVDFSALIFAGYALMKGHASLVSALSSSIQPIFIFILALFTSIYLPKVVMEKIDKKTILTKVLAIVLTIAGIVFINLN